MTDFKYFIQNRFVFGITALLLVFSNTSLISQKYSLKEEIRKLALYNTNVDPGDFPFLQIAIIDGEHIEYVHFDNGNFCPGECHDFQFNIGEIGKSVISYALYDLIRHDKIRLSDPVQKYLNIEGSHRLAGFTVEDLLMNRTGLPISFMRNPEDSDLPQSAINAGRTMDDIFELYNITEYIPDIHSPNKEDFILLAEIVHQVSGVEYGLYVDSLFKLRGAGHFCFEDCRNAIPGYDRLDNSLDLKEEYGLYRVVDGIFSDVENMAMFVSYMLNTADGMEYINFVLDNKTGHLLNAYIANNRGWNSVDVTKKRKILISQGITPGYRSFVGLFPDGNKGVVLLTNSGKTTEGLGYFILKMISDNWKVKK